jgi:PTS system sucrose-specific IIC component
MAVKIQELTKHIVELVGGVGNIRSVSPCMTRVRILIRDTNLVKRDALNKVEGVLGLQGTDTLQVVVGPGKSRKVVDEMVATYKVSQDSGGVTDDWRANKDAIKSGQSKGSFKAGLETIAGIFIPLIPAIIAAGIFNGLASVINATSPTSDVVKLIVLIFQLIGTGFLGYFAIFTGVNAAKRFGASESLGGMVGAMTIAGQIPAISRLLGFYNEAVPLESILINGKGGIIGVILAVWLLSKVERAVRKRVPDVLDIILTPMISLLVVTVLLVLVIMPFTGVVSDLLVTVLSLFIGSEFQIVNILSGFILSALFLPMVLLGLHHGLIPIYAVQLESLGGISLFPVLAMAGAGQVGAAIAIYLKARKVGNTRMQSVITGALPAGFLGIGEPLIYGVTLPLGKPFITAGLGAGFGGAFIMAAGVTAGAFGPSGLVAIPLMQGATASFLYFVGLVISYIMGFIITTIVVKNSEVQNA